MESVQLNVKPQRKRSKNFESSEITLITELVEHNINIFTDKFKSSSNTNTAFNNEKKRQIWEKITERVNSLGISVRTPKEVRTKWNNLHQEAKAAYIENAQDMKKTGGGPLAKPLSTTVEKIVELYKDCPRFTGLSGVESIGNDVQGSSLSPIDSDQTDTVEIFGTPQTLSSLSKFAQQAAVPVPDAVSNPPATSVSVPSDNLPATSSEDIQIIDWHLESEKSKNLTESVKKRKVNPEDVTQMQYEVLVEQKKKLIQQTLYYELMNKKLKLNLGIKE